jgi:hypothetical protein
MSVPELRNVSKSSGEGFWLTWRRRSRRAAFLAPAVGLALATAACGGGAPEAGVASLSTTTTTSASAAATSGSSSGGELGQYATCMRSHGVLNFPDSFGSSAAIKAAKGQMAQISESEASSPIFQAAQRACAKYYGPPTTSPTHVSTQEMQRLLAVSRCMRTHGVLNFPDPNPTTGELSTPAGIDKNSPQVLAALRACQSLGRAAGLGPPNTG